MNGFNGHAVCVSKVASNILPVFILIPFLNLRFFVVLKAFCLITIDSQPAFCYEKKYLENKTSPFLHQNFES